MMKYYVECKEVSSEEYCEKYNTGYYIEQRVGREERRLLFDKQKKENKLRQKRKKIFDEYFDVYKLNYNYGLETPETEEEHQEIVEWYNKMLDIEKTESALENIPERIKRFID